MLDVRELALDEYHWPLPGDVPYHRALGARPLAIERAGHGWAQRWSSTAARSGSSTPTPRSSWRRRSTTRAMPPPSCWPSSRTSSSGTPPASWSRCQGPTARWLPCSSGASPSRTWTRPARARIGLLADPTRHTMHGESRVATGSRPADRTQRRAADRLDRGAAFFAVVRFAGALRAAAFSAPAWPAPSWPRPSRSCAFFDRLLRRRPLGRCRLRRAGVLGGRAAEGVLRARRRVGRRPPRPPRGG